MKPETRKPETRNQKPERLRERDVRGVSRQFLVSGFRFPVCSAASRAAQISEWRCARRAREAVLVSGFWFLVCSAASRAAQISEWRYARRAREAVLVSGFWFLVCSAAAPPLAQITPPNATIGDPITITFPQAATVNPSPDYEVVSQSGNRVVVRTFKPKPFTVSGRMGQVWFRDLVVPVRSVLKPSDPMQPAPLIPPRAVPYPRSPFVAIGIAAFLAIVGWTAVVLVARRRARVVEAHPQLPPEERFRLAVRDARNWAMLSDAVRDYLAATRAIGRELTTAEVLQRDAAFAEILRNGDLEKFSPWGAPLDDFRDAKSSLETAA